jgi:predicted RNase H-like nuclease (RuvC/YqgF family)
MRNGGNSATESWICDERTNSGADQSTSSCTICPLSEEHPQQHTTAIMTAEENDAELKRLEELVSDVVRLKTERGDLIRQNVTCKTDIRKLKNRYQSFKLHNCQSIQFSDNHSSPRSWTRQTTRSSI